MMAWLIIVGIVWLILWIAYRCLRAVAQDIRDWQQMRAGRKYDREKLRLGYGKKGNSNRCLLCGAPVDKQVHSTIEETE
jgi:hypothetical protein